MEHSLIHHPRSLKTHGVVPKRPDTPADLIVSAPCLGQFNEYVFCGSLGLPPLKLEKSFKEGVL